MHNRGTVVALFYRSKIRFERARAMNTPLECGLLILIACELRKTLG